MATSHSTRPIAPFAWRILDSLLSFDLPRVGGCYAIYLDGELAYIGQTCNIRARLASYRIRPTYCNAHFTPWGQYERVVVKVKIGRRFGEWAMRELRLIRRLRPRHNSMGAN